MKPLTKQMTPQQIVDAFVRTGGKIITKKIAGPDEGKERQGMCKVVVLYDLTKQTFKPRFGDNIAVAAEEIDLPAGLFLQLAKPSVLRDKSKFVITMYFDASFCNPPA